MVLVPVACLNSQTLPIVDPAMHDVCVQCPLLREATLTSI